MNITGKKEKNEFAKTDKILKDNETQSEKKSKI